MGHCRLLRWYSLSTMVSSAFSASQGLCFNGIVLPPLCLFDVLLRSKTNPIFRWPCNISSGNRRRQPRICRRWGSRCLEQMPLADLSAKNRAIEQVILHGETSCDEPKRCALARELGKCLGVDYDALVRSRMVTVSVADEIRSVSRDLLTSTHTRPASASRAQQAVHQEIEDNREFLAKGLVGKPLRHLCYPSGVWSRRLWPWLADLQIMSATTWIPGLNGPETPRFSLRRFLDGEDHLVN